MSFGARIALAMAGVALLALAIATLAGGPRLRRSFLGALRGSIDARIDAIEQAEAERGARAREEIERLARAPRIVAALQAGDGDTLAQAAADELRDALARAGEHAGFVFVGESGAELARSPGLDPAVGGAAARLAARVARAGEGAAAGWSAVAGTPVGILAAAVIDRVEDSRVGALALCSAARLPAPLQLPDGTVLESGIAFDGALFGTSLPSAARAEVAAGLARGESEVEIRGGDAPSLVRERPLPGADGASLVVVAGLGPLLAAERAMLGTVAGAAAVALALGLGLSLLLARGLSRPVEALAEAAARIEAGDYAVRLPVPGQDELSGLARRFNAMADGLAQRDRYRRVLDAVTDPDVAAELIAGRLDLGGAEQEVGILFCDIRGFTHLAEGMAPQRVVALLNEHMSLLTDVAFAHGGTVDKFVGDMILVTFGTPRPAPDDALRMVLCARAMIDARSAANGRAERPVEIGIGCAFGKVVAGCMGSAKRLEYTVIGERVNLAARLCSSAPPMQVRVDLTTRDAVAGLPGLAGAGLDFAALSPIAAKGFSKPVEAFELVAAQGVA